MGKDNQQDDLELKNWNKDAENDFELNLSSLIVLKHDSCIVIFWNVLNIICCLTSCYFYGWLSLFGLDQANNFLKLVYGIFEGVFFIKMCFNFVT